MMAGESGEITTKSCPSCKQDVPVANYDMHTIHCQRFLKCCPHCKEFVPTKQLDEHIQENHVKVKCDDCGDDMEKIELNVHKETSCRRRHVKCDYCEINLPALDMDEHKESCGSRSEECDVCKKRILVKDMELHANSGCKYYDIKSKTCKKQPIDINSRKAESLLYGASDDMVSYNFNGFPGNQAKSFFHSGYNDQTGATPYFNSSMNHKNSGFTKPVITAQQNSKPKPTLSLPKNPAKRTSTSVRPAVEKKSPKESSFMRSDYASEKFEVQPNTNSTSRKAINIDQMPLYGIPDSDSDDDGDGIDDEKKSFPDLTDDTFLPCEFCQELFPADSLVVHQASCGEVPPTPRPNLSSFGKKPAFLETLSYGSTSTESMGSVYSSGLYQASGSMRTGKKKDLGEGSGPCEFCDESYPFNDLAIHQITCSNNPNNEEFQSGPRPPSPSLSRKSLPEFTGASPRESQPNVAVGGNPPFSLSETQAKRFPSSNIRSKLPPREKRSLAPSFSNASPSSSSIEVKLSNGALPETKSTAVEAKDLMNLQRGGELKNSDSSANVSSHRNTYQEVNVLDDSLKYQDSELGVNPRKANDHEAIGVQLRDSKPLPSEGHLNSRKTDLSFKKERGIGRERGSASFRSRYNSPRYNNKQERKGQVFQVHGLSTDDARENWNSSGYGNAAAEKSQQMSKQRSQGGHTTRGRSRGARTTTAPNRESNRRSGLSSQRDHGRLPKHEFGSEGRQLSADSRDELWEGSNRRRGGGRGRGQRKGTGGSRVDKNWNPRS